VSLSELKCLDFVHGVTILRRTSQGPCPGAGQELGAKGLGQPPCWHRCPQRLLCIVWPIGSSALINAALLSGQAIYL